MKIIYLLYDSIENSIFAGQVWEPLIKKIKHQRSLEIILISFERKIITHLYQHNQIKIIQIKRFRYWGKISLIWDFLKILKHIKNLKLSPHKIIARGPFAGWVALKLFKYWQNLKITIQARGLAAEEYQYNNRSITNFLTKFLIKLRYLQLFNLEKQVYYQHFNSNIAIECVSAGLATYLINTYQTNKSIITIAKQDLPRVLSKNQLNIWRFSLRKKLGISPHKIIYCYSGSNQAWQCYHETIAWFVQILKHNQNAFLLILTPQTTFFKQLVQSYNIPDICHLIISVQHQLIYQYLAMADFGLLFREAHIVNWVARPTKALEYHAANLPIIHNKTVAWLVANSP